jgi:ACR3 family arsenite transporter
MLRQGHIWRQVALSIILNWIVGPFVSNVACMLGRKLTPQIMLAVAWATLPDQPTYRTGVIMVGLAR